ncbi:MAG TPA: WcaF family extracellular polysaccharide biosynthesis acetyltransferase [Tepidisphaeraceae bacterium]|nr:WcaF family extracellular polysaccharide biosynthesis acetyltransferase [Tepidisphaeraceae bacterium]
MTTAAPNQLEQPASPPAGQRAPVDIIIPTYNERLNIPFALQSVTEWASNVFVLDSGSTDGTQQVARELGATVVEHPWEGYARQKNWALDNLPLSSAWTFILDADEVITPALRDEIVSLTSREPDAVREAGFYVNRYLIFLNKRIQHCGYFPSWNLRLFKRGMARYEDRAVHEHMVVQGRTGFLKGLMEHEDRRGLEFYIAKHNRYSTLEAEAIFFGERGGATNLRGSLFGNAIERRRFFKTRIYPGLPGKWLGRFIWMYFIKLGVLDGSAGLRFCLLISSHELFTSLKLREMQIRASRRRPDTTKRAWRTTQNQVIPQPPMKSRLDELPPDPLGNEPSVATNGEPQPARARLAGAATGDIPPAPAASREPSPWSLMDKTKRALWMLTSAMLFRPSFHNWYGWRRLLLRAFGARVGRNVRIRPSALIEIPWNLELGDDVVVGDRAILYSLGKITIHNRAVISQYAHLCAGTHDYRSAEFPLLRPPITIGEEAWVAADAFIGPSVTVGPRVVVGARSVVVRDAPAGTVVAGNPARVIKQRPSSDVQHDGADA